MKSLTISDAIDLCGMSRCPHCHTFLPVTTVKSEDHLITTSGHCNKCHKEYMIDRSYPAPFEFLGGHEYEMLDTTDILEKLSQTGDIKITSEPLADINQIDVTYYNYCVIYTTDTEEIKCYGLDLKTVINQVYDNLVILVNKENS